MRDSQNQPYDLTVSKACVWAEITYAVLTPITNHMQCPSYLIVYTCRPKLYMCSTDSKKSGLPTSSHFELRNNFCSQGPMSIIICIWRIVWAHWRAANQFFS